jgi:gamma-glutamyltranspeptidase / glutathione hydrolase
MRRLVLPVLAITIASALATSAPSVGAAAKQCKPGVNGCIPTPEQCAGGNYNGYWAGPRPDTAAVCIGGAGHVAQYAGGDPKAPCGAIIESDVVITGSWDDPNRCFTPPSAPGSAVRGSRYVDAVRSPGGVVAAESPIAAAVGRRILAVGGNAVDAAVATVFAYGVARPENCGIGGRGYLLYRGANGRSAALDFHMSAPAAVRPDSLDGLGIDDLDTGHRMVGVPGVVAGMAAAVKRFGSMPLAKLIAPAEHLARRGVPVTPALANAYSYFEYSHRRSPQREIAQILDILPFDPLPGKINIAKLRLFPEAANIYLQAGVLPYAAGSTLVQRDYADSLALIMRQGPKAFYRGGIARLIDEEMRRSESSPYPGDEGLLTYKDLASYKPIWRRPLSVRYRGTTVLGAPPPSSSLLPMEMLAILQGFNLRKAEHSSADHVHLVAEAQKLARADLAAYLADPAFERVPTDVLLSPGYAASRRALIKRNRAGDYRAGSIPGVRRSPSAASTGGHTTHVSVVDAAGNAVAISCTIGPGFGSGVVARGTGFLLATNMELFSEKGHPNEPEAGKRPAIAVAPLIVVRDGIPILVTGGGGGHAIPPGVAQMAINTVDFGMDVGRAIDVARFDEASCCSLSIEEARIPPKILEALEARGHTLLRNGEYGVLPWLQLAAIDPRSGTRLAASDPRGEYGAAASR